MFNDLPTNIVLEILTYLPLNTIASLALVSRWLHSLINSNENPIYHRASFLHGYIPSYTTSLQKAHSMYSRRSIGPISNWKNFCAFNLLHFYDLISKESVGDKGKKRKYTNE